MTGKNCSCQPEPNLIQRLLRIKPDATHIWKDIKEEDLGQAVIPEYPYPLHGHRVAVLQKCVKCGEENWIEKFSHTAPNPHD